jgi:hypothetical protein
VLAVEAELGGGQVEHAVADGLAVVLAAVEAELGGGRSSTRWGYARRARIRAKSSPRAPRRRLHYRGSETVTRSLVVSRRGPPPDRRYLPLTRRPEVFTDRDLVLHERRCRAPCCRCRRRAPSF